MKKASFISLVVSMSMLCAGGLLDAGTALKERLIANFWRNMMPIATESGELPPDSRALLGVAEVVLVNKTGEFEKLTWNSYLVLPDTGESYPVELSLQEASGKKWDGSIKPGDSVKEKFIVSGGPFVETRTKVKLKIDFFRDGKLYETLESPETTVLRVE